MSQPTYTIRITNKEELANRIESIFRKRKENGIGGVWRVSIVSVTDPAKAKSKKGRIYKVSSGNIDLGANFAKRREENGLAPSSGEGRRWGVRRDNTPVVDHKGKFYITGAPVSHHTKGAVGAVYSSEYVERDGNEAEKWLVEAICGPKGEYVKGNDQRDFSLENITKMSFRDGDTRYVYEV